jgi:hypothetical protein
MKLTFLWVSVAERLPVGITYETSQLALAEADLTLTWTRRCASLKQDSIFTMLSVGAPEVDAQIWGKKATCLNKVVFMLNQARIEISEVFIEYPVIAVFFDRRVLKAPGFGLQ